MKIVFKKKLIINISSYIIHQQPLKRDQYQQDELFTQLIDTVFSLIQCCRSSLLPKQLM